MLSEIRTGILRSETTSALVTRAAWISLFALLTGVGAFVKIPLPFTPVPITLQTAVVLASGLVLGRDGIWSQILYVVLGGIGIPIFASGFGLAYLFGPTGGYLIGFVAVAALTHAWVRPIWSRLTFPRRATALFAVSLVVFVPGVLQLKWVTGLSLPQALSAGFLPFLVGDALKVLAVSTLPARFLRVR